MQNGWNNALIELIILYISDEKTLLKMFLC